MLAIHFSIGFMLFIIIILIIHADNSVSTEEETPEHKSQVTDEDSPTLSLGPVVELNTSASSSSQLEDRNKIGTVIPYY